MRLPVSLVVILLSLSIGLKAQFNDSLSAKRLSSFEGYHFFVAYMQNDNIIQSAGIRLRLMMCSAYSAQITVRFSKDSTAVIKLAANSATTVLVPSRMEVRTSEMVLDSVVEVLSDVPISVFAMNSQPYSSDSYAVIPVSNWNTDYTIMSMANDGYGVGNDSNAVMLPEEIRQSEFLIVAAFDSTIVEFNPTYVTQRGAVAGQWHTVKLKKGQCYLVKSAPIKPLSGDLTGSHVRANRPIAVLSGHARSSMPQSLINVTDSKDHLAEWLIPDQALGYEYITMPFYTDGRLPVGDVIRIVATKPQTQLTVYTERADLFYTLKKAGDIQTISGVNSPCWIRADQPVSVAQFMLTGWVGGSVSYDPSMALVPPADKFVSHSIFQVPSNLPEPFWASQFQQHFVNIICDSLARYSMKLDGVNIGQSIEPNILYNKFRSSPYFWARIPLSPGKHELSCDTFGFSGALYGMGMTDSYAHTMGFSMATDLKDTIAPFFVVNGSCGQLNGTVNEVVNAVSSSLSFVVYDPDSTKNFSYIASTTQQNANVVTFSAKVVDPKKDAQLFITARDIAGNGRRYRYYYHAPRYTFTSSVSFAARTENDSICSRVYVQSPSTTDTLRILSAKLSGNNPTLKLFAPSAYPITVLPRTGADFQLCFRPQGQSALKIVDTIIVDLGCGVLLRIPVKASTPKSALFVSDIAYGDVKARDSVCAFMEVVNTGTRVATLLSARFDTTLASLGTLDFSKFPVVLPPGDTFRIRFCFHPLDTMVLNRRVIFSNDIGVDVEGEISGRGVRPIVKSQSFDFGSLRIAIFRDTNVVFHNTGNSTAKVSYRSQTAANSEFLHSMAAIKSFTIAAGDSATFGLRFYPQSAATYSTRLLFSVDDPLDTTVLVDGRGVGTVPIDSVRNLWFDTIQVKTQKSLRQALVFSKGSEALTIDTIRIVGPDAASFTVGSAQLARRVVDIGDSVVFDVQFKPQRSGRHDAQLELTHDADKAYFRRQSYVQLSGWARDTVADTTKHDTTKVDTLAPRMLVRIAPQAFACDSLPISVVVTNRDTIALVMNSYRIESTVSDDAAIVRNAPISLLAGRSYTINASLHPVLRSGTVQVHVVCAKWTLDTTITVNIRRQILRVNRISQNIQPDPGDTMLLRVEGSLDGVVPPASPFELSLSIPNELFHLLANSTTVRFSPTRPALNCTVQQSAQSVIVRSSLPISADTSLQWSLELPFQALVSQLQSTKVQSHLTESSCFQAIDSSALIVTNNLCAPNLRQITTRGFELKSVFPQPAGDNLTIVVRALTDYEFLTISLCDVLGRKFQLEENLFLRKDDNSLILDLNSIPSGMYRLELRSWDDLEHLPIMLTK